MRNKNLERMNAIFQDVIHKRPPNYDYSAEFKAETEEAFRLYFQQAGMSESGVAALSFNWETRQFGISQRLSPADKRIFEKAFQVERSR
jgi:hypothetical protein